MKKYFFIPVVIMCLFLFACSSGEKGETAQEDSSGAVLFQKLSLEEAQTAAANQNKLIMVDVFSPT